MRSFILALGLVPALWSVSAEAQAPPADAGPQPDAAEPTESRPAALDLSLSGRVVTRDFTYKDDLFQSLSTYSLDAAPALGGRALVYPGAFSDDVGVLADIGVEGNFERLVAISSQRTAGETIGTSSTYWYAGLRGRLPIAEVHEVSLGAAYGEHSFEFGQSDRPLDAPAMPSIPDVGYQFLRTGIDARFVLTEDLSVGLGAYYLWVFSSGQIGDSTWFPNSSTGGLELGATLGYEFVEDVELRLGAALHRYFYDLAPEPGDAHVAGGAVDQYLNSHLGVAWRL